MVVIMVIKKNYFGGAWSFKLFSTPNLMGLPGYGGYGGYLDFEEKIIEARIG